MRPCSYLLMSLERVLEFLTVRGADRGGGPGLCSVGVPTGGCPKKGSKLQGESWGDQSKNHDINWVKQQNKVPRHVRRTDVPVASDLSFRVAHLSQATISSLSTRCAMWQT